MPIDRQFYSYRADKAVPVFDDTGPRTVMDANCALCARNDKDEAFKIIPLQSNLGSALMIHYGMDPADPTSWLCLDAGEAYNSLDAFMRVGKRLGGVWRGLLILKILPSSIQGRLYSAVARNRYRLFGRADLCAMPDKDVRKRLMQ